MVTLLDPEISLLTLLFGDMATAKKIARAPGGWRTLNRLELGKMKLKEATVDQVLALQQLVERSYPPLPDEPLNNPRLVAEAYDARLGALPFEVLIALGLDARFRFLGEVELSRGGAHAAALTPADVLRPLIRMGATACIVLHNHPSGDPTPSREDLEMTSALEAACQIVDISLVDHLVIAGRGNGSFRSLYELGHLPRSLPRQSTVNDAPPLTRTITQPDEPRAHHQGTRFVVFLENMLMPRLLIMPLALASNGTVLVNVREFFPDPVPRLVDLLPRIAEPVFVGVPATDIEVQRALRRLAHGHREAAAFLVGGRKSRLLWLR